MISPKSSHNEDLVLGQEVESTASHEGEAGVEQDIPSESIRSDNSTEQGDDDMMLCKAMKADGFEDCNNLVCQVAAKERPENQQQS